MDSSQANGIANHFLGAIMTTADVSRYYTLEAGSPPSLMTKVHMFRSATQARLAADDRYELNPSYLEFGRIQFTDLEHGGEFLVKSPAAVLWESGTPRQTELFAATPFVKPSGIAALIYKFDRAGLELLLAPTTKAAGGRKIVTFGEPVSIGIWSHFVDEEAGTPFNQDVRDRFDDIGDLGEGDSAEDGQA